MPDGALIPLELYPLAQGYLPGVAPGQLAPGSGLPIWRDMLNLSPDDGQLRFRDPVIASALGTPPYSVNDATAFALPLWVGEIPLPLIGGTSRYLVITTLDWWLYTNGAWRNVTPSHNAGTVATAGTAVTGTTTAWLTKGIKPGDLFEAPSGAGNWKVISAINSDTSITLASSIGVIGAGSTYRIRRTAGFAAPGFRPEGRTFVRVLNGDIYVATMVGGGRSITGTSNYPDGAVVKITGGAVPGSATSWTVSFLTSGSRQVEAGVDNVGYNFEPLGLEVLEDGRLVMPISWIDFGGGGAGDNRVLYSSHLNLAVWTSSPGGFTDIAQRRGIQTGLGRLGRSLSLHFTDQIRLCEPTGQDDPPLAFPQTSAVVGAAGPGVIVQTSVGELFVGTDRQLYRFDGASAELIAEASFGYLLRSFYNADLRQAFATVDEHRGEYSLFVSDTVTAGANYFHARTTELRFNFRTKQLTRHSYPFHVHAASDAHQSIGDNNYQFKRSTRQRMIGVASFGNSVSSSLIYVASEDPTTTQADAVPNVDNLAADQPFAETDDLDFGSPNEKKTLERVEVWCRAGSSAGAETVECLAYSEGTASSVTGQAAAVSLSGDQETVYTFYFTGSQRAARLWRFRLQAASGDTNFFARMIKLIAFAAPAGDLRAAS